MIDMAAWSIYTYIHIYLPGISDVHEYESAAQYYVHNKV